MGKSNFMFTVLLCIASALPAKASINSYTLEDALKKNLITASITANKDGYASHYGECIAITLKNKTSQNLSLRIENGRRLDCTNDSVQDMLVTRSDVFALLPAQQQEYTIYAMCCEKHNRSPKKTSVYHLGTMAESILVQLTLLIEKLNVQNYTGQQAVWVLTDDNDMNNISGDTAAVSALKKYLNTAIASKKKFEREKGVIYDYSFPKEENHGFTIEGDLDWQMPYRTYVSLYVYDNYGNRVKVVFQDVVYAGGWQNFHYKVTSDDFRPGELYWVRMKSSDKTLKEVAIQMD